MSGISQKARAHPLINPKRFFARELLIFECIYPSWEGTHFQSGLKIGRSEAADFQPGASRIENDKRFSTRSFVHWKSAASDRSIFNPNWKWYFVLCFRDAANSLESIRKNHYNQWKWKLVYTFFSFRAYTSQWHTPLSEPKLSIRIENCTLFSAFETLQTHWNQWAKIITINENKK